MTLALAHSRLPVSFMSREPVPQMMDFGICVVPPRVADKRVNSTHETPTGGYLVTYFEYGWCEAAQRQATQALLGSVEGRGIGAGRGRAVLN